MVGPWQGYWGHYWPGGSRCSTESNNRNSIKLIQCYFLLPFSDSTYSSQQTLQVPHRLLSTGKTVDGKKTKNIFSRWLHDTDRSILQNCSDKTAICLLLCYKYYNMKQCSNKGVWVSGWIRFDKIEITAINEKKSSGKGLFRSTMSRKPEAVTHNLLHLFSVSQMMHLFLIFPHELLTFLFHFVIYRTFILFK